MTQINFNWNRNVITWKYVYVFEVGILRIFVFLYLIVRILFEMDYTWHETLSLDTVENFLKKSQNSLLIISKF